MAGELNEKQKRFADAYVVCLNATQAALDAGYSEQTAHVQGCNLLKHPKVSAYIQERMHKRSERTEITQDWVLRELAKVAGFDPRKLFEDDGSVKLVSQWDDSTAASVSDISTVEMFDGSGEQKHAVGLIKKVQSRDKIKALELLGKHLGMFRERTVLENPDGSPLTPPRIEIIVRDADGK